MYVIYFWWVRWRHQFQFAGFYAAIDLGYFHAAGLDVRLIPGGPDIDSVQVVIGGGAEFGIGNSSSLINHAWGAPVAERLPAVVRGLTLHTESGDDVRVALSIGVTEIDADDADMLSGFDWADCALYRAKTLGRDRVALA